MNQQTLLEYLKLNCQGRSNAATGKQLQTLFQCKDIREIQKAIERLRQDGFPILSADQGMPGYFWPKDAYEAKECLRQLENRAKHTFRTWWNVKKAVEETFKNKTQLELEFKKSA
jgi:predicted house-cleaning NTP pyrophosphatase (Maf/HAM1 superfamily)